MIILDKINTVEGGRIEIPFYHKGHLSLKSNTEVTVCLIPYSSETPFGNMPEVIVSPIKFSSWPHIWRITAVFRERQGIVHKLLSIVRDAEMNVLVEESSSVENRNLHEIELLVDTSAVFGRQDNSNIIREAAEALQRRIIAICIEELALMNGTPRLKVSPVKGISCIQEIPGCT